MSEDNKPNKKKPSVLLIVLSVIFVLLVCVFVFRKPVLEFVIEVSSGSKQTIDELKPVLYLYPEKETKVHVDLEYFDGGVTISYPEYNDGWDVSAMPDGTLYDVDGNMYKYLYWEAEHSNNWDFSEGFCVKNTDSVAFLEEKLELLGLSRAEMNDFIVYWLPVLQSSEYNLISFQTKRYDDVCHLDISPQPDSVIRVFMAVKPLDGYQEIDEQLLETSERSGFTAVEWGGSIIE